MPTATMTIENVSTLQPTSHLYELSPPLNGVTHVAVTVATLPNCPDEAIVLAADETGAIRQNPSQPIMWILHRAADRTHAEALSDIGYELMEGS
ncbi:hypothetical protein CH278_02165 [Rhodococcus sp. 05-2254-5]|nr:hypothetical protein CH278_02165 [Rhodococcus sp. 05-2254-5]OZE59050.1 hypothetical protein CH269_08660 [Rhodococcus sp. 05-2254-1]